MAESSIVRCRDCGERIRLVHMPHGQWLRYEIPYGEGLHSCSINTITPLPTLESNIHPSTTTSNSSLSEKRYISRDYLESKNSSYPKIVILFIIFFLFLFIKEHLQN